MTDNRGHSRDIHTALSCQRLGCSQIQDPFGRIPKLIDRLRGRRGIATWRIPLVP
jgi:hypothetical protein